jgi:hypothetical protein
MLAQKSYDWEFESSQPLDSTPFSVPSSLIGQQGHFGGSTGLATDIDVVCEWSPPEEGELLSSLSVGVSRFLLELSLYWRCSGLR